MKALDELAPDAAVSMANSIDMGAASMTPLGTPRTPRRGLDGRPNGYAATLAVGKPLVLACMLAGPTWAWADERVDRPVHGSFGGGTSFLLTGDGGDRTRFELELDIEPASRYGGLLAWRAVDPDHHGLLLGGLIYEGGAARPRLVLDLHADIGVDLDQWAPVAGGGIRTTLTIWGPFGLGLDTGAYLVIDGIDDTRLVIATSASAVVRW